MGALAITVRLVVPILTMEKNANYDVNAMRNSVIQLLDVKVFTVSQLFL